MAQENPVSPIPFEWSVATYENRATYVVASRNGIPVGTLEGKNHGNLPEDHYHWTFKIFMPGAQVPEPIAAPMSALVYLKDRFKIVFDQCCERLEIRPVYPMLIPQWRDLGDDGHGLFSGQHLVHRIYKVHGKWWHESYLRAGPEIANSETQFPFRYTLANEPDEDCYDNTLEGAKNRGSLRLTGWLLQSNFMMRWDPNSLPVGQTG